MDDNFNVLLAELKAEMEEVYGTRLKGIYLFGSRAREEGQSESDVDVLLVLDAIQHYGAEIERTGELGSELSLKYGVSISRVFIPQRDWLSGESVFLTNVREEAIAI